ncbi:MAG: VOC family protein [Chloroflexi bacterium]|nr:VOC family protein [Chloroflexota bacterium]
MDHLAVFAKDLEATAAIYAEVAGMPVINVTANRDVPESTHINVDLGNGAMLSFFGFPHVPRSRRKAPAASCVWLWESHWNGCNRQKCA